jgi:hypothetical protein
MNKAKLIELLAERTRYIEDQYPPQDKKIALFEVETLKNIIDLLDQPQTMSDIVDENIQPTKRVRKISSDKNNTLFNL